MAGWPRPEGTRLAALGWAGSKSSIYRDVQAAGEGVAAVRRQQPRRRVQVASADATYVVCRGQEVTVAVALDALAGDVLQIELLDSESADALRPFLQRLQTEFGIEALLSDDQDSYKVLADELGLGHGICRTHVNGAVRPLRERNVAKLVGELAESVLQRPEPAPPGVASDDQQLLTDLEYVQQVVALRPNDGARQLAHLLQRYQAAPPPRKGTKASVWYRFRMALVRWWNQWTRLTFDQPWNRQHAQRLDGTNNVAERAIGNWIKERYRTMRTYKRPASVRNLTRLIPCLATRQDQPVLATLLAC